MAEKSIVFLAGVTTKLFLIIIKFSEIHTSISGLNDIPMKPPEAIGGPI